MVLLVWFSATQQEEMHSLGWASENERGSLPCSEDGPVTIDGTEMFLLPHKKNYVIAKSVQKQCDCRVAFIVYSTPHLTADYLLI